MVKSNPTQKKLKIEKGERLFSQILNLGEGLRGKNNGGEKIWDQIKKLKFIYPMRTRAQWDVVGKRPHSLELL